MDYINFNKNYDLFQKIFLFFFIYFFKIKNLFDIKLEVAITFKLIFLKIFIYLQSQMN